MRLTAKQLNNYKNRINRVAHDQCVLRENGIFEIHNVLQSDVSRIVSLLKQEPYIADANSYPGRYNFNKFDFAKGYAEPEKYFTIRGILKDNLLDEAVEIHDKLNPKIWTEDKELIPEVRAKILQIVDKFKSQLATDGLDLKVEDIYVLGSNANYNYTEESDLDVHIIADESFDCSEEHLAMLYNCYKTLFNNKYDIRIKGINVEIYVENKDKLSNISAGVYSLNNGWLRDPAEYEIPDFDQIAVDRGVQQWEDKYFDIIENPSIGKIDNYIDDIYALRQQTIKDGEFAEGNLIFKEIRRRGYLDDLKNLKIDLTSRELSLESLDEDVDNNNAWKEKLKQFLTRLTSLNARKVEKETDNLLIFRCEVNRKYTCALMVEKQDNNRFAYCLKGLQKGKDITVTNLTASELAYKLTALNKYLSPIKEEVNATLEEESAPFLITGYGSVHNQKDSALDINTAKDRAFKMLKDRYIKKVDISYFGNTVWSKLNPLFEEAEEDKK